MKISTSRSGIWSRICTEFEYYAHIRECGFRYIDYDFYSVLGTDDSKYMQPDWEAQIHETRNQMEKIGVRSLISHAPSGEPANPETGEGILRRTKRAIECAAVLGCPNLVYHVGSLPGTTQKEYLDFNENYVRQLLPLLEKHNITLLQENVGRWDEPFYCRNAEEMLALSERINHPLYQFCLDTGHLSLQDGSQYETIMKLGSGLRGLHVQDNFGSLPVSATNRPWRQDLHLPPLMGCVDFDEILTALKAINYSGVFNIEPESPRMGSVMRFAYPGTKHFEFVPLHLMKEYYSIAYEIVRHLLTSYNLYEE